MNRRQRRAEGHPKSGRVSGAAAAPIEAWFRTALTHQRAGRVAEAEWACRRILSIERGHAQTLHLLGLIEHQRGRSEDAIAHIRDAIERDGRDPAFRYNLGNILRARGRYAEAMACYEQALALAPNSADILYNLGNACQDLRLPEQAVAYFKRGLHVKPDAVELHNNLGTALQELGRHDEAIACYCKALRLRPDAVEVLDNLGGALRARGQLDPAQACYERALALRPDRVESHIGLGIVLRDRGRLEDAVACYEQALKLAPEHPEARNNLGVALADLGQLREAVAHYQRALAVRPDCAETHYNLGVALEREGRYADAIASYERALALKPDYAPAHLNHALALLSTGEFDKGWKEYEWRFVVARYDRKFGRPLWKGEPLGGQRILIHAEQGFGDTLQFVRYVPAVAERGGIVVLEVPQALVRLVRTVPGTPQVVAAGDPLPPFECHCPLLSLPRVFDTRLTTIPNAVPYLAPPTEASVAWAGRIAAATGLKVGVVWAGTTVGTIDLRLLEPLWKVSGVSWFSLQAGSRAGEISLLDGVVDITDLSPWLTDFAETAAAVSQLDIVITVDTSVAHLSGALGRPTWILLPSAADWRWLIEREDSPWYPTARLFRLKQGEDWPGVARDVAAALEPIARHSLVPRD